MLPIPPPTFHLSFPVRNSFHSMKHGTTIISNRESFSRTEALLFKGDEMERKRHLKRIKRKMAGERHLERGAAPFHECGSKSWSRLRECLWALKLGKRETQRGSVWSWEDRYPWAAPSLRCRDRCSIINRYSLRPQVRTVTRPKVVYSAPGPNNCLPAPSRNAPSRFNRRWLLRTRNCDQRAFLLPSFASRTLSIPLNLVAFRDFFLFFLKIPRSGDSTCTREV